MGVRGVTIAMMSLTLAGLATGCATSPSRANRANVASTADRLEQDADLLARDAAEPPASADRDRGDRDYAAGFARDTHQLAIDTHELRRTVDDRDSSHAAIQPAFDRVSRSFHAVRDEVNHSDTVAAQRDFRPVANDYGNLRDELGGYPDRDARADNPPPPIER